jgi:DNA gyrase subunit A
MRTREEDFVDHLFIASTHSYILIFTDRGRVYWRKVHEIPDVGTTGKGKAIVNLVHMRPEEKLAAVCAVREFPDDRFVLMATRSGKVKKTPLSAYANLKSRGIIAMGIDPNDSVIAATITDGGDEAILATRKGSAIRFSEQDVRSMGRTALGVRGMSLGPDDEVVGMSLIGNGQFVLSVTENGYGKRTVIDAYRLQSRGGKGIINIRTSSRNGKVTAVHVVRDDDEVMVITAKGMLLRLRVAGIGVFGRATQGVRVIQLDLDDQVVAVAKLPEKQEEEPEPKHKTGGSH